MCRPPESARASSASAPRKRWTSIADSRAGCALDSSAGKRQEILDQPQHPVGLGAHQPEHLPPAGLLDPHVAVGDRLEESAHHRERRLELVRHVRHEVAAHRLEALPLGDVAREQELLVLAVRDDPEREHELLAAREAQRERLVVRAALQVRDEVGVADEVEDRLAGVAPGVDPVVALGRRVRPHDVVLGVEDDHPVGHRLRGAAEARELRREAVLVLRRRTHEAVEPGEHVLPHAGADRDRRTRRVAQPDDERAQVDEVPEKDERETESEDAERPGRTLQRPRDQRDDRKPAQGERGSRPDGVHGTGGGLLAGANVSRNYAVIPAHAGVARRGCRPRPGQFAARR